jgi:hypothetical protein
VIDFSRDFAELAEKKGGVVRSRRWRSRQRLDVTERPPDQKATASKYSLMSGYREAS